MKCRYFEKLAACIGFATFSLAPTVTAQTRIMCVGDSITQGGQQYASYRYELWFKLTDAAYDVDFVGGRDFTNGGDPNLTWYPDYFTTFDRDHEGYWGWRTDQVAGIITAATTAAQPDIVLMHLGTNDIGQNGAAGVTNADTNLRAIIGNIRSVTPNVTIVLAQVIPIGPGSGYSGNASQVDPLNIVIADVASDLGTANSPIILIDQNTGYDINTMMQSDGLHPNLIGEEQIADVWFDELELLLPTVNPPPTVSITTPVDGAVFSAPVDITISADAADNNGSVTEVTFYNGAQLLGVDTNGPYTIDWHDVSAGNYSLTAVATDNEDATRTSSPISIAVLPPEGGLPVVVPNPSFESPVLGDSLLAQGNGVIGGWTFAGTANTYLGIFNPPIGSYPTADGNQTPTGADGANVAFLFNNGGPSESVTATMQLSETLAANMEYTLTAAIGKFLPDQPYAFSTYGGYRIELLAGSTVIADDTDSVNPGFGMFQDAFAVVSPNDVDPVLLGQPLSIRLNISATQADRSTHFDHLRLTRRSLLPGDADNDGDIDVDDFAVLIDCVSGPGAAPSPTLPVTAQHCLNVFDSDDDADLDLGDVAAFLLLE